MLQFTTESYRDVTFFDTDGEHMLAAMGCSGKVPGALGPEAVRLAHEALRKAIRLAEEQRAEAGPGDDDDEATVAPESRAQPLLELLESAAAHEDFVTWARA